MRIPKKVALKIFFTRPLSTIFVNGGPFWLDTFWNVSLFEQQQLDLALWHSTVWPQPIWNRSWWQIPPQYQSTYLRGTESVSIEIPSFSPHFIKFSKTFLYEVNLTSQHSHVEILLLLSKFWSKRGISKLMQILNSKVIKKKPQKNPEHMKV